MACPSESAKARSSPLLACSCGQFGLNSLFDFGAPVFPCLQPSFALAGASPFHFSSTPSGYSRFAATSPPALSGPDNLPADPEEAPPRGSLPPKLTIWDRIDVNPFWRTRGLWLGLGAVGLAMYAQKLTTVDRDILSSIHWYVFAIFVLLLGWLNTYTDRSFLVQPIERIERIVTSHMTLLPYLTTDLNTTEARPPRSTSLPKQFSQGLPPRSIDPRRSRIFTGGPANASPSFSSPKLRPARFHGRLVAIFGRLFRPIINIYSAQLLRANYYSVLGSWGRVLSLVILLLAFVREPNVRCASSTPY